MTTLEIFTAILLAAAQAGADPSSDILKTSGVQGGLVVHLGCGDGKLTAALRAGDRYVVHGLDADVKNVEASRRHIQSLGRYGPVSVRQWAGDRLPYVDNLVNLVVADGLGTVAMEEVMRVLAPGGVALIGGRKTVKPWPAEIDEWTHYLHGPDNNAVACDSRVGIPRSIQWASQPRWGRSHEELASMSAAVTAQGRIFCHLDPETGEQLVPEARFNMEGTTSDVLSGDGDLVFLKYFTFDRAGARTETTRPHLFSITSLLGEDWFVRTYWIVGQGMPAAGWSGWADASNTFPSGQILSFDNDTVYGYGRENLAGGPVGHRADTWRLFAEKRTGAPPPPAAERRKGKSPARPAPLWADHESLIVRAMVLGRGRLAVAGPPDLGRKDPDLLAFLNESEARAGFEGRKGACLRIVDAADGKTLSQYELPAMPVFDGMAAAGGRLYLSTLDGRVLCLAGTNETTEK